MCGIAGILTSKQWTESKTQVLNRFCASLRSRGPDDSGTWIDETHGVGLAHTRLAILDLSPAGHQPMHSSNGNLTITFNGEIYNFRELRAELEMSGHHFHSGTDTEVILNLYAKEGPAMLSKLRGMFAFCIWDHLEQKAFIARDPFGIKPLYYSAKNGEFAFASELKVLRQSGLVSSELNAQALEGYFEMGSVPSPLTLLKDVQALEAGSWLQWQQGKISKEFFWTPHFATNGSSADAIPKTRSALLDSVRSHFVSDVPVGIFLSGGIDSTVLVALAREIGVSDLSTFSLGSGDPLLDESHTARRTAQHFKTNHEESKIENLSGPTILDQFFGAVDQPSIDGLNTFIVSSLARQKGVKVVLSGLGADEVFGGYPSFQKVPQLMSLGRMAHVVPGLPNALSAALHFSSSSSKIRRFASFLQTKPTLLNAITCFRSLYSQRDAKLLAARYCAEASSTSEQVENSKLAASLDLDQISEWELTRYMRNQLLRDSDVMSMAHGLELRVPFVDKTLFESLSHIPAVTRLAKGKKLLLSAVPELPEWVLNHSKKGFTLPFERWISESPEIGFTQAMKKRPLANTTWHQKWAVFMLEKWLQQ